MRRAFGTGCKGMGVIGALMGLAAATRRLDHHQGSVGAQRRVDRCVALRQISLRVQFEGFPYCVAKRQYLRFQGWPEPKAENFIGQFATTGFPT